MTRVALFMDYENFYTGQRKPSYRNPYGTPPELDFLLLVEYIEREFGTLRPQDFIVAANFSHFNTQKGGLNKVATIQNLDSFLPREVRARQQSTSGKFHVAKNYADMWLAYEIGRHVQQNPADIYIIASNDKDFLAVGHALQKANRRVVFLVPNAETIAQELALQFEWRSAPDIFRQPEPPPVEDEPADVDPVATVLETLGQLRRTLSAGIPLDLLKALLPPEHAADWVKKAYGQSKLDFWQAPNYPDVQCVSLRAARIRNQVIEIDTRAELVASGKILYTLATQVSGIEPSHAAWRRAIKDLLQVTNNESKRILNDLFACQLLDRAFPTALHVTLEKALCFITRQKEARQ